MDVKKKLKVSEFFNLVLYRSYRLAIFYLSIFLEITTIIRMQAQYGFSYLQIIYIEITHIPFREEFFNLL